MNKGNTYLIIIISILLGVLIGVQTNNFLSGFSNGEKLDKFNEVLRLTQKYHLEELETGTLVESAIRGMFNELDPHTTYIAPVDQSFSDEQFRGNFEGIGIEFQILRDTIMVVSPITGGPSEAVGILAGDRIVKVDGENCVGFSNSDVINTLRGEKGTPVNITIYRPSIDKMVDFDIIRDEIPIFSVDAKIMLDENTGYINVTRFAETTSSELLLALEDLSGRGMNRLVLDLRNNPGGLLSQAHKVSDLFIDENKLIVYTEGRIKELDERLFAELDLPFEEIPLIVLINRGSASGSEIVAGAVQDWDRGLIVGERSFGKGLVQRPFILEDNSAIRLTVAKYFTPSGRAIQRNFENGRDEYYDEIRYREADSDSIQADTSDSSRKVFYTDAGREVYGGGGIYPDYNVSNDSITNYSVELRRNNVYYIFIRDYLDENRDEISAAYSDAFEFNKGFNFTASDLKKFISTAGENGVEFDEEDYNTDRNYIALRLKAYIARELWKNSGWYSVIMSDDKILNFALTKFVEAEQMMSGQK